MIASAGDEDEDDGWDDKNDAWYEDDGDDDDDDASFFLLLRARARVRSSREVVWRAFPDRTRLERSSAFISQRFGCANGIKPENPGDASFECTEPVDNESHRSEIEQPFRRRLLQRIKNNISADLYLSPGDRELGHSDRL